jgi:hypothetical protein
MRDFTQLLVAIIAPIMAATIMTFIKVWIDKGTRKQRDEKVQEAEREAFRRLPDIVLKKIEDLSNSQEGLETKTNEIARVIEENRQLLQMGSLFNLYNRQIESYQDETRSRASWSFYVALIAMFAGFAFVIWGGKYILSELRWDYIAAGGAIASIGGSISAFLPKTFLDVHKLSLNQLNRYFQQPVINDHVLMAQRLADNMPTPEARQKSYEVIIQSLTKIMTGTTGGNES